MAIKIHHIVIAAVMIVALQAFALFFFFGNPILCSCNSIKIWDNVVRGPENSQHLVDWYSFSHIIYGFILYFLSWLVRQKVAWFSLGAAFIVVLAVSAGWEMFENTHYAVENFHDHTISFEYRGDSVVNSIMDTAFMALGFWLAYALPWWLVVGAAFVLEAVVMYNIRDNLVLSTIMFVNPLDFILQWQKAALYP